MVESTVKAYVQASVAINLEMLRRLFLLHSSCWAISVAFHAAKNREVTFVDVHIRLCANNVMKNIRVIAISIMESYKEVVMHKIVQSILDRVSDDTWRHRVISLTTDGARNMI